MPRIVVVGSLNMDLVVRAPRFAAPGETISGRSFMTAAGGKGANQAVAARRMGAEVAMVGRVGDDAFGRALRDDLDAEGLDVRHLLVTPATSTGVALITVDDGGENTIVVVPGANGVLTAGDVSAARATIAAADVVMLQLEVPLATVRGAATLARESGAVVILNAAPAGTLTDDLLALLDYLIVNTSEARAMAEADEAATPETLARALQTRGPRHVVVTRGVDGALLAGPSGATVVAPAHAVDAIDTTAAGDAFAGAFAVAIAEGLTPREALQRGAAAGALAVTRAGAQPSLPTRTDVDALTRTRG